MNKKILILIALTTMFFNCSAEQNKIRNFIVQNNLSRHYISDIIEFENYNFVILGLKSKPKDMYSVIDEYVFLSVSQDNNIVDSAKLENNNSVSLYYKDNKFFAIVLKNKILVFDDAVGKFKTADGAMPAFTYIYNNIVYTEGGPPDIYTVKYDLDNLKIIDQGFIPQNPNIPEEIFKNARNELGKNEINNDAEIKIWEELLGLQFRPFK